MDIRYKTSEDLAVRILDGKVIISNVFSRSHFHVSPKALELLVFLSRMRSMEEIEGIIGTGIDSCSLIDHTNFSLGKGLVCNPDNFSESATCAETVFKTAKDLVEYMETNLLIYSDRKAYLEHFKLKESLFDRKHLGNFHQQIGRHAMMDLKKTIDDWWVEQKFLDDHSGIRNTPYKFVQEEFFKRYFTKEKVSGRKFLDIGCGIGYYDKILAQRGAIVTGIDPNKDHIDVAKKKFHSPNLDFIRVDINKDGLGLIKKGYYDAILISDTLLFYFVAPNPKSPPRDVVQFLKEVRDVLKPDGSLYILEPHGAFFLQAWYGAPDRPYAMMTEYRNRMFRVVPTLEELASAFSKAGYLIKEIHEPSISEDAREHDVRGFHFCSEFPIWWFFHLVKDRSC